MNACELIIRHAIHSPNRLALINATTREGATWFELADRAARFRRGLAERGFTRGDRIAVMLAPGADAYAFLVASLAEGIATIFVHPDSTARELVSVSESTAPDALVVPRQYAFAKWLVPSLREVPIYVDGPRVGPCESLQRLADYEPRLYRPANLADEPALISADADQAIVRTHRCLHLQHQLLAPKLTGGRAAVAASSFPLLAFHELASGTTTVLPPLDADGRRLVDLWRLHSVTRVSGPPALFDATVSYLESRQRQAEEIEEVVIAGDPEAPALRERIARAFPNADCTVIYPVLRPETVAVVPL